MSLTLHQELEPIACSNCFDVDVPERWDQLIDAHNHGWRKALFIGILIGATLAYGLIFSPVTPWVVGWIKCQ